MGTAGIRSSPPASGWSDGFEGCVYRLEGTSGGGRNRILLARANNQAPRHVDKLGPAGSAQGPFHEPQALPGLREAGGAPRVTDGRSRRPVSSRPGLSLRWYPPMRQTHAANAAGPRCACHCGPGLASAQSPVFRDEPRNCLSCGCGHNTTAGFAEIASDFRFLCNIQPASSVLLRNDVLAADPPIPCHTLLGWIRVSGCRKHDILSLLAFLRRWTAKLTLAE